MIHLLCFTQNSDLENIFQCILFTWAFPYIVHLQNTNCGNRTLVIKNIFQRTFFSKLDNKLKFAWTSILTFLIYTQNSQNLHFQSRMLLEVETLKNKKLNRKSSLLTLLLTMNSYFILFSYNFLYILNFCVTIYTFK